MANCAHALPGTVSAAEYAAFHLPGAHSLDLVALLGAEAEALLQASAGRTVVLYSNAMVHPAPCAPFQPPGTSAGSATVASYQRTVG